MSRLPLLAVLPLGLLAAAPDPPALRGPTTVATSTVVGSPDPPPPYRVKRLYPNFTPTYPILAHAVPGSDQLLVLTETNPWGASSLFRLPDRPDAAEAVKLLDIPDASTAYDFTFHPRFAENRFLYVGWNGPVPCTDKKKASRVTRYTLAAGPPLTIDPKSATTIIEWESNGHNGAAVCFGPDGLLYVTTGDGTSDSDTDLTGQKTDTLLAKVLRIDVDRPANGKAYSVPADNPFVNDKRFVPETWAYGLRNPWRITADAKSGQVWVGNNGQDLWEQAYLLAKGANYGWSVTEGGHPFYPTRPAGPTPIVKPTIEHHHSEFRSLTGGVVVRGTQLPDLDGAYLYADYSTGRVWGMKHDGMKPVWHRELATPRLQITGFGTNTRGELLICDHSPKGGFYTLEPNPPGPPTAFPRTLSASGLFAYVPGHRMAAGVIPYSLNAPFWSDGLHKQRFLALPPGGTVGFTKIRGWSFPDRTVIVKSFAADTPAGRRWVETRFLTKQDGEWYGYSYRWNATGTDAELVPAGGADAVLTTSDGPQPWRFPSRSECMACHSRAQNFVLGLCTAQLNRPQDYAGRTANQITAWEQAGVLTGVEWDAKAKDDPDKLPRLSDPADAKADLTARARAWLHANCSSCHLEAGGGNAQMELEAHTPLDKMRAIGVKPLHDTFDLPDARLIAPGAPDRSVLLKRACTRGPGQMPPLASSRIDAAGTALLRAWITDMKE